MKVLVLAPHTDDGQFCCGGTIAKLGERGDDHTIHEIAFSFASDQRLRSEWEQSILELWMDPANTAIYDFPVRRFQEYRQNILDIMIHERDRWKPDLVMCPSSSDTHQDHQTIREECFRAFKGASILGYETPWNNIDFRATAFTSLAKQHVDAKSVACRQYSSQHHRPYAHSAFLEAWARMRGVQIASEYAEAFEVIRWIM